MNSQTISRALFLAGMMLASSAFATEINKCVGSSGSVTLTDEACPNGSRTVKVISGPEDASADEPVAETALRPSVERYTIVRMPSSRYATVLRSAQPARGMALDIATLKAARANMHLFDSASQAMRSSRLAGLQ